MALLQLWPLLLWQPEKCKGHLCSGRSLSDSWLAAAAFRIYDCENLTYPAWFSDGVSISRVEERSGGKMEGMLKAQTSTSILVQHRVWATKCSQFQTWSFASKVEEDEGCMSTPVSTSSLPEVFLCIRWTCWGWLEGDLFCDTTQVGLLTIHLQAF